VQPRHNPQEIGLVVRCDVSQAEKQVDEDCGRRVSKVESVIRIRRCEREGEGKDQ
jgi:hypothetical protein